jgi:hypothetical protein
MRVRVSIILVVFIICKDSLHHRHLDLMIPKHRIIVVLLIIRVCLIIVNLCNSLRKGHLLSIHLKGRALVTVQIQAMTWECHLKILVNKWLIHLRIVDSMRRVCLLLMDKGVNRIECILLLHLVIWTIWVILLVIVRTILQVVLLILALLLWVLITLLLVGSSLVLFLFLTIILEMSILLIITPESIHRTTIISIILLVLSIILIMLISSKKSSIQRMKMTSMMKTINDKLHILHNHYTVFLYIYVCPILISNKFIIISYQFYNKRILWTISIINIITHLLKLLSFNYQIHFYKTVKHLKEIKICMNLVKIYT